MYEVELTCCQFTCALLGYPHLKSTMKRAHQRKKVNFHVIFLRFAGLDELIQFMSTTLSLSNQTLCWSNVALKTPDFLYHDYQRCNATSSGPLHHGGFIKINQNKIEQYHVGLMIIASFIFDRFMNSSNVL